MKKNFNTKIIVFSFLLGIINLRYFNNSLLKYFSYLQLIYICYLCFSKKIVLAYKTHIICILSSATFPANLDLVKEVYEMNTYSKLKIMGPISISYLGLALIFFYSFYLNKKSKNQKELQKFIIWILVVTIPSILIGIGGLIIDNYNFNSFLTMFMYVFNLVINLFLLKNIFYEKYYQLEELVISLLISAPLITLILTIFKFTGSYGGVIKYASTEIFSYSSVLLLIFLYKEKYLFELIIGLLAIYLGKNIYGGKDLIIILIIVITFFYKVFNNLNSPDYIIKNRSKKIIIVMPIVLIGITVLSMYALEKITTKDLFYYKLQEVIDLLDIENLTSFESISKISFSPRVRIISIINTFYQYIQYPLFLFLGMGYGGYYRDYLNLYKDMDLTQGAYSIDEIKNNIFFSAHDTIPAVFLTNGVLGLFFIFYWAIKFLKKIKNKYLAILCFNWIILVFGFNHHISLFISICIVSVLYEEKIESNINKFNLIR